jgi:hypothetical protein
LDAVEESAALNRRLLTEGKLPGSERSRIEKNLAFCTDKLSVQKRDFNP